jgi:hypothetical protein
MWEYRKLAGLAGTGVATFRGFRISMTVGNGLDSPIRYRPQLALSSGLMASFVLIVLVWVLLPVFVYRTVNAASGLVLFAAAAAAASVAVAVVALERGFRVGKALLQDRRSRRGTFS